MRSLGTFISIAIVFVFLLSCKSTSSVQRSVPIPNPSTQVNVKDVYLIIGQSNTAGRATIEPQDTSSLEGVYLFNAKGDWEPAKNPLNKHSNIRKKLSMQKLSYAYSFGKIMRDKTGQDIGLLVNARGGTKIEAWLKNAPEAYFDSTLVRIKRALQLPNTELKGIIWHQGESDKKDTADYLEKLSQFVTDLRESLGQSDLPFIAGQISRMRPANEDINKLLLRLPKSIPNTSVVKSKGLNATDSTHFDAKSQHALGRRYAKAFSKLTLQNNN